MRELGVPQPDINAGSSQFPAMHVPTEAPAAAFGGGQAVGQSFEAGQKLAETVGAIAEKHQEQANQVMHTDIDTQLAGLQSQVQIQAQQMRGKDAMGAQAMASNAWASGVSEIMKQAQPNKDVYRSASASAAARGMALNDAIHQHTTQELFTYENQQTVSGLKASQNLAALNANMPDAVSRELGTGGQVETLANQYFKRNGIDPGSPTAKEFLQTQKSAGYRAVIDQNVTDGNFKMAMQNFNQIKKDGNVTDSDLQYLTTKMQKAKVDNTVLQVFNDPKYKLMADGNKDGATMVADIDKRTDLNDEQKKDAKSGIYQMVNDQDRMNARKESAQKRGFENTILDVASKNPNVTVSTLNAIANVGFKDQVDLKDRLTYIDNLKNGTVDQKEAVNQLATDIFEGRGDPKVLTDGLKNGTISAASFSKLSTQLDNAINKGPNPEAQGAWKEIQQLADQHYGKNSSNAHDFLYYMYQHSNGTPSTELVKFAKDQISSLPKQDFNVWSRVSDYNKAKDISRHWYTPGNDKATFNAVQSLRAKGFQGTPAQIDAVLVKYKDGKF